MDFRARLRDAARRNSSWVCVGLDPDPGVRPELAKPEALLAFNRAVVEATRDLVCAYKANSAYYEALGPEGVRALAETRKLVPSGVIAILDAKRGDVPHSAEQYARAAFDVLGYDAVTANAYLGLDSLEPFLSRTEKGCFALLRTTNPGAAEIQDADAGGAPLHEVVGRRIAAWSRTHANLGVVAGATGPEALARVRGILGDEVPILVPGVGTQGGNATAAAKAGGNARGELAIISASRSVIYAGNDSEVRKACEELREKVNAALAR